MKAQEIINDIKWRIKDHKENIKWLRKQLETDPNNKNIKDEIGGRLTHIEAHEMVLRGFGLI